MGNKEVTAIGTTSLIHHTAIQIIIPSKRNPSCDIPLGGSNIRMIKKRRGPNNL